MAAVTHRRLRSNSVHCQLGGATRRAGAPADDVHYDFAQFGLDRLQTTVAWNRRTSLIVGPDGTIPPLTPEARKKLAEREAKEKGHEFDSAEHRPLEARCIARAGVGPPLLPSGYNSNLQIVQGCGYVAIEAAPVCQYLFTLGCKHACRENFTGERSRS